MAGSSPRNRGKAFENYIDWVNNYYRSRGWARIDKIATPAKQVQGKMIYTAKSTVDYVGVRPGGQFIAFDCKQTKANRIEITSFTAHQVEYLREVEKLDGIGFFLIWLTTVDRVFKLYVDGIFMERHWIPRHGLNIADLERVGFEIQNYRMTTPPLDYLGLGVHPVPPALDAPLANLGSSDQDAAPFS